MDIKKKNESTQSFCEPRRGKIQIARRKQKQKSFALLKTIASCKAETTPSVDH